VLLASASPRRREILDQLHVRHLVIAQDAEELATDLPPVELACENARRKARAGASPRPRSPAKLRDVVVGVDTIVVLEACILGKPRDARESYRMIESLSGRTHDVISGIHLELPGPRGRAVTLAASTRVSFRRLSRREIRWYVSTDEGSDKAGAYGIQGLGAVLVERIDGCYFNVVGFPVRQFLAGLDRLGVPFPALMVS
jgi:septum formation protein